MRRGLSAIASAVLLLSFAGAVDAANPHHSYGFHACYDSANNLVVLNQAWSAIRVDEVSFGIGDGQQGLGVDYPIRASKTGNETASLGFDPSSTVAGGSLLWKRAVVASGSIGVPAGGWSALPAC